MLSSVRFSVAVAQPPRWSSPARESGCCPRRGQILASNVVPTTEAITFRTTTRAVGLLTIPRTVIEGVGTVRPAAGSVIVRVSTVGCGPVMMTWALAVAVPPRPSLAVTVAVKVPALE